MLTSIFINLTTVKLRESIRIYRVRTICNDCSLNRLIFGITISTNRNEPGQIKMRANKYRKGIRNFSANSVNQADTALAEEFRMTERETRWGGRGGAGRDRPRHSMGAWQCWVGWGRGICLVRVFSICLVGVGKG